MVLVCWCACTSSLRFASASLSLRSFSIMASRMLCCLDSRAFSAASSASRAAAASSSSCRWRSSSASRAAISSSSRPVIMYRHSSWFVLCAMSRMDSLCCTTNRLLLAMMPFVVCQRAVTMFVAATGDPAAHSSRTTSAWLALAAKCRGRLRTCAAMQSTMSTHFMVILGCLAYHILSSWVSTR